LPQIGFAHDVVMQPWEAIEGVNTFAGEATGRLRLVGLDDRCYHYACTVDT